MARRAKSLDVLVAEINQAAPNRGKGSDGWLGDPAHQARASRHNPNGAGVVCAQDITHDPAGGMDIHLLARKIVMHPQRDLEYVISNGQVAKRRSGFRWEPYTGENKHNHHAHFAVGQGPDSEPSPPYDDTEPWGVSVLLGAPAPGLIEEDDMAQYDELLTEVRDNLRKVTKQVADIETRVKEIQATQERELAGDG